MNSSDTSRNLFLDGLRGWGAIMVMLSHLIHEVASTAAPAWNTPYLLFPIDGTFAVYVFFVVSGFALSCGYFSTRDVRSLASLAAKRYPRLMLPILASSLIGLVLWRSGLFFNQLAAPAVHSPWLDGAFTHSPSFLDCLKFSLFDVFFNYHPERSYNTVFWTISIELYGSMVVFWVLALFGPFNRFLVYIISAVICAVLGSAVLAFIFGVAIADAYYSHWKYRSILEVAAPYLACGTLFACIATSTFMPYPHQSPRFLSILAALSVLSVTFCVQVRRFFELPLSRLLGRISFPLYLTHMLVILSFTSWLFLNLEAYGLGKQAASNWIVILTVPLCFLAAICFLPVESVSIRIARWFSDIFMYRDKTLALAKLAAYKMGGPKFEVQRH